jgi:class 3 adenylate cyclase
MATVWVERRLAAILVAHVEEYPRLVEQNEAGTLSGLKALRREAIDLLLAEHPAHVVAPDVSPTNVTSQ